MRLRAQPISHAFAMNFSPYSLLMLAGIGVSIAFWVRLAKRDERLLVIYIAALVSALLGAKIVYLAP